MLENAQELPMRQLMTVPSCVPSVPGFENSKTALTAPDYDELFKEEGVIGLGEIMDYEGVINNENRIHNIIKKGKEYHAYLQGHAPLVKGQRLSAYLCAGPSSDHEAKKADEIIEKYRKGMWIDVRDGNTSRNMQSIIPALKEVGNFERICFSSDDRRCNVTLKEGHMDGIVRNAVSCGMPVIEALISASYRVALEAKIERLGAIAPGYIADLLTLHDLESLKVEDVFFEGKQVSSKGNLIAEVPSSDCTRYAVEDTLSEVEYSEKDFSIYVKNKEKVKLNYMAYESYTSSVSELKQAEFKVIDGKVSLEGHEGKMFVAVFNRYGNKCKSIAVVDKFGIDHGALASSVGHDSHNITIVFDTVENGYQAMKQLMKQSGGFCAVENGEVIAEFPLPIAGLMSKDSAEDVARQLELMVKANQQLGNCYLENPVSRITILSLLVCPYVKISDMGMVDTEKKQWISTICEE